MYESLGYQLGRNVHSTFTHFITRVEITVTQSILLLAQQCSEISRKVNKFSIQVLTNNSIGTKLYIVMEDVTAIYEEILQKLEKVILMTESMHTPSLSFGTGVLMHTKEIHTIQAIGRHSGINVTRLAEQSGVTKGAVSQTINKLVRKGLVRKTHPPGNDKEVVLELTDLGQIGFKNHEKFHMDTLDIAREYYGDQLESKLERIYLAVDDIHKMLSEYEKRREKE